MSWVLVLATTWTMLAALVALGIGRAVRVADRQQASTAASAEPDFVPASWATSPTASR
ncbi:hypothetical protein [Blastococcus sp. SYSU DS0539]